MKITLDTDDVIALWNQDDIEFDFDLSVFKGLGIEDEVRKALEEQVTTNGRFWRETRAYIDSFICRLIPTEVGNYIRTKDHTCQRLISESVEEHIASGIESGIKHFAQKKAKQIAETLAEHLS